MIQLDYHEDENVWRACAFVPSPKKRDVWDLDAAWKDEDAIVALGMLLTVGSPKFHKSAEGLSLRATLEPEEDLDA